MPKSTPVYVHTFLTGQAQVSWNAVCKLIAQVDAHCAEELLAIGVPDQDSMPAIAETLETLECAEEAYLVLDSFEASGLPQPERLLEALSRHGGECLHVVALTRRLAQVRCLQTIVFICWRRTRLPSVLRIRKHISKKPAFLFQEAGYSPCIRRRTDG